MENIDPSGSSRALDPVIDDDAFDFTVLASIGLVFSVAGALCFVPDFAAFAPALMLFTPTGGFISVVALNACRHRKARDWIIPIIGTVLSLGAILVIILTILGVAVTFATVPTD